MKKERFISLKTKMTIGIIFICILIGSFAVYSVTGWQMNWMFSKE